jgi:D-tyrosyl-tRNA(Tyr) deacylase
MIAVIQRVTQSSVSVEGLRIATIGPGLLVLFGVARGDTDSDVRFMVEKFLNCESLRTLRDT